MKYQDKCFNRVCYVSTLYALLLYLLNTEDDNLDDTLYILDPSFPKGYENRLKYSVRVPNIKIKSRIDIWKDWLAYKLFFALKLPPISKDAQFYIQDHKYPAKILCRNTEYTLIEDSPGVCSRYFENSYGERMLKSRKKWNYHILKWLYGPLYGYHFGCSNLCTALLFTTDDNHPNLDGKKRVIIPKIDNTLWNSLSEFKRRRILEIYDLTPDDLDAICRKKYLLLTDPVWPDDAPYDEHDRIFHKLLQNYPIDEVVIKTHPRDLHYPYEKEFPGISVFRKAIPMEIFKLIGVKFSTIITLFSTAVSQFEGVDIDWYGTEVSEYCFKHYGHIEPPVKVNEKKILV